MYTVTRQGINSHRTDNIQHIGGQYSAIIKQEIYVRVQTLATQNTSNKQAVQYVQSIGTGNTQVRRRQQPGNIQAIDRQQAANWSGNIQAKDRHQAANRQHIYMQQAGNLMETDKQYRQPICMTYVGNKQVLLKNRRDIYMNRHQAAKAQSTGCQYTLCKQWSVKQDRQWASRTVGRQYCRQYYMQVVSQCMLPRRWIQEIKRMYPVLLTHGLL